MGITLIFVVLLIVGLIMMRFTKMAGTGLGIHLIGAIGAICCGVLILIAQCPISKRSDRIAMEQRKTAIEWGIENITQVNSLDLIDNIKDYNSDILKNRMIHDNFWTSWFVNDVAFEFELIDVNDIIIKNPLEVEVK